MRGGRGCGSCADGLGDWVSQDKAWKLGPAHVKLIERTLERVVTLHTIHTELGEKLFMFGAAPSHIAEIFETLEDNMVTHHAEFQTLSSHVIVVLQEQIRWAGDWRPRRGIFSQDGGELSGVTGGIARPPRPTYAASHEVPAFSRGYSAGRQEVQCGGGPGDGAGTGGGEADCLEHQRAHQRHPAKGAGDVDRQPGARGARGRQDCERGERVHSG
ncbi:hypothetical protein T484DRAFT_3296301 [Baffinella frigidus]|nr:hypothetical protein T484DRAFT_3296301 [Cryptophyta sp. CCMP2293]